MADPSNHSSPASPSDTPTYPPVDVTLPQLTLRAVLTAVIVGGGLSLCNVYAGLKIGWGLNMSIATVLISFGFWKAMRGAFGTKDWLIQENNIAQTGASAAASISSAGLVSAVPALTMLTGYQWDYPGLALWVFCCSILGVTTAMLFRRQMLVRDALPFASGIATAETLREVYAHGKEAMARFFALVYGAAFAAAFKIAVLLLGWTPLGLPGAFEAKGAVAAKGVTLVTMKNLTMALDPSFLMVGSGVIVGFRTGAWMLLGAIAGWVILGLDITASGSAGIGKNNPDVAWFGPMVEWLLWPGVAMLVTASLTALAFSAPAFIRAFRGGADKDAGEDKTHDVPVKYLWAGLVGLGAVVVLVGAFMFDMAPHIGLAAVALTILLAVVALRVTGETNITPVGGMGKVTQLTFGAIDPGNVATNLMAANITGGSSSQAADMMNDLKTGMMIGGSPKQQMIVQMFGVFAGALAGAAIYLVLVDDPIKQFPSDEWAAPAVLQWKAVAEVMKEGFDKLPAGVPMAILIASILGVVLASAEKLAKPKVKKWLPSPAAIGISFCVPAWISVSFFLGGTIGALVKRFAPSFHMRFAIVIAAGLIVGESLAGLGDAIYKLAAK